MDSFDPDEEIPFIEPSEDDAVQLRHNRVTVDSQAALELLESARARIAEDERVDTIAE